MMGYTDRHFRYLIRSLTQKTLLYTEMLTARALLHGDRKKLLAYSIKEKPLVLQLAGCDSKELGEATAIATDYGFDEINLNVGCPSERAGAGRFGACLFLEPEVVADCIAEMRHRTHLPLSIKHRLGIRKKNKYDSHASNPSTYFETTFEELIHFVELNVQAGCNRFIVHARKAYLENLSPEKNLSIPPLDYSQALSLSRHFPQVIFEMNGGIASLEDGLSLLHDNIQTAMIGRAAYFDPLLFTRADELLEKSSTTTTSNSFDREFFRAYVLDYLALFSKDATSKNGASILRHTFNFFKNQRGARKYRNFISQNFTSNSTHVFKQAMKYIEYVD